MQLRVIIVVSLAVVVLARPNLRFRRDDSTTAAPQCGDGTVDGLLLQVANLLDGILANLSKIHVAGVIGGNGDLVNLRNLLNEVRILLSSLLGGGDPNTTAEQEGLLTTLIGSLTSVLDNLLGKGTGARLACQTGGAVNTLLTNVLNSVGSLTDGIGGNLGVTALLNGALQSVLDLVGLLLHALV